MKTPRMVKMTNEENLTGRVIKSGTLLSNAENSKTSTALKITGETLQTMFPIVTRHVSAFQLLKGGSSQKVRDYQPSSQNGLPVHRANAFFGLLDSKQISLKWKAEWPSFCRIRRA